MVSFIIYENNSNLKDKCVKTIKRFLYTTKDCYKIYEVTKFDLKVQEELARIGGTKIYILDLDNPSCNTCSVARQVREKGDLESQIILLTRRRQFEVDSLNNILYLDLLIIDDSIEQSLKKSIMDAYEIITKHAVYSFSSFDEVYRLPYNLYFCSKNEQSLIVPRLARFLFVVYPN